MIKFLTFHANVYRISTLATVATENKMHVTSHFNTHIYTHNYDNYVLYAKLIFSKELVSCIFCVKNNTRDN